MSSSVINNSTGWTANRSEVPRTVATRRPSATALSTGVKANSAVAEPMKLGMVIVNSGTGAKSPSSPSTFTVTAVDEARTDPSGREAVTVIVCSPPSSSASVMSSDNRMSVSSSAMVSRAGLTLRSGWFPMTVRVLSALGVWSSAGVKFQVVEPCCP